MQQGERFIREIDKIKQQIEAKNIKEFNALYKRIGNDLINLLQKNANINFQQVLENYKGDYVFLFRKIFQDVKKNLGYGIRKDLNFNLDNQIILKAQTVDTEDQIKINDLFDEKYTLFLNNETEALINDNFIESEAKYFGDGYTQSIEAFNTFIEKQKQQEKDYTTELMLLLFATNPDKRRRTFLEKQTEALKKQIETLQQNRQREVLKQYTDFLKEKIPVRSQSNTEYATGQASSQIREIEYQAIKESQVQEKPVARTVITTRFLADRIKKVWWEKSQFIAGAKPRINHLAISGTQSNSQGNFYVSGYEVPHPRHSNLPRSETARCRCEIEYDVI